MPPVVRHVASRALPAALLGAALMASAGCGSTGASAPRAPDGSAAGIVLRIERAGGRDVTGLVLRTATGEELTFAIGPLDLTNGGFPAEHLAEHQVTAEPVLVEYARDDSRLVALRLTDAP